MKSFPTKRKEAYEKLNLIISELVKVKQLESNVDEPFSEQELIISSFEEIINYQKWFSDEMTKKLNFNLK